MSQMGFIEISAEDNLLEEYKKQIDIMERLMKNRKVINNNELASVSYKISEIYRQRQMYEDAIKHCTRAIELLEELKLEKKLDDEKRIVDTYLSQSSSYFALGMNEKGLEYYETAIKILDDIYFNDNREELGEFVIDQYLLGIDIYKRLGMIDKVITKCFMVVHVMESEIIPGAKWDYYGPMYRLAGYYREFGDLYFSLNMIGKAIEQYYEAANILEELDNVEDLDMHLCAYYDVIRPKLVELCTLCTNLLEELPEDQRSDIGEWYDIDIHIKMAKLLFKSNDIVSAKEKFDKCFSTLIQMLLNDNIDLSIFVRQLYEFAQIFFNMQMKNEFNCIVDELQKVIFGREIDTFTEEWIDKLEKLVNESYGFGKNKIFFFRNVSDNL